MPRPDPTRPISEGQARRLFAIAVYDNAFTEATLTRMLRYYGYHSAERVTRGAYDRLCEIAADPIAAKLFAEDERLPGERPWLASEDDPGAFLRAWNYRVASDDFLKRQVALMSTFATHPVTTGGVGEEVASTVDVALRELDFRLASLRRAGLELMERPVPAGFPTANDLAA